MGNNPIIGHLLLLSPNDIGVLVQHAFRLCVNVLYGHVPVPWSIAFWISTVILNVVCTVSSVTQWSKVVPLNGSEAPLVFKWWWIKSILLKARRWIFCEFEPLKWFWMVKTQRFKKMHLLLHQISKSGLLNLYLHIHFLHFRKIEDGIQCLENESITFFFNRKKLQVFAICLH